MATAKYFCPKRQFTLVALCFCASLAGPVTAKGDVAANVSRKASNSVVTVEVTDKMGKKFQGSGVVIKSEKGNGSIIVTNAHVVSAATSIRITHKKSTFSATLLHAFAEKMIDLAFLKVDERLESAIIRGVDIDTGTSVFAIGSPFGLQTSISAGIIAGKREARVFSPLLQTTTAISPGSSGGGLFDTEARLVGITSFKVARGEGLNFAIDASDIPVLLVGVAGTTNIREAILKNKFVDVSHITAKTLYSDGFVIWLTTEMKESKFKLLDVIVGGAAIARSEKVKDSAGVTPQLKIVFSGLIRSWEMSELYEATLQLLGLNRSVGSNLDPREKSDLAKSKNTLTLHCVLTARSDGSKTEKTLQVDFGRGEVDGIPAEITDNSVRFSLGKFNYLLSRISGQLVVETVEFPQIFAGPCETVSSRKF